MRRPLAITAVALLGAMAFAAGVDPANPLPQGTPDGLYAIFTTEKGVFVARLFEKYTPISVRTFVGLASGRQPWLDPVTNKPVKRPMFDNITFHRVIRDEMIQSGDPTGTSKHNCGFTIPDEFLIGLQFSKPGMLAMANSGQPNSGACQWFVTTSQVPEWNNKYTIFGEVIGGMDVVQEINHEKLKGETPVEPVKLISVRAVRIGAPPAAKGKTKGK